MQLYTKKFAALAITFVILSACGHQSSFSTQGAPPRSDNTFGITQSSTQSSTIPSLVLSTLDNIVLYDSAEKRIGVIKSPDGFGDLAIDKAGSIYYASASQYASTLSIYSPPYSGVPTVISFGSVGYVTAVAVDWTTGVFAVTTAQPTPNSNAAVSFFRHGETSPCDVIQAPSGWAPASARAAFDAAGVLFTAFYTTGPTFIASISGQCQAKSLHQYSPTLPGVGDLQFDTHDHLVVEVIRTQYANWIATYGHPAYGKLGALLSKTPVSTINGKPPLLLTLSSDGKTLWASSFTTDGVGLFDYPSGGSPIKVLKVNKVAAGAVYPQIMP